VRRGPRDRPVTADQATLDWQWPPVVKTLAQARAHIHGAEPGHLNPAVAASGGRVIPITNCRRTVCRWALDEHGQPMHDARFDALSSEQSGEDNRVVAATPAGVPVAVPLVEERFDPCQGVQVSQRLAVKDLVHTVGQARGFFDRRDGVGHERIIGVFDDSPLECGKS
jgi:hypothetical protein